MRVILVNPYPYYMKGVETTIYPPLGLLYIGAYIKNEIEALQILDANVLKQSTDETLDKILAFKPDIVGVSVNIATSRAAKELIRKIREYKSDMTIVVGGPLPTVIPKEWLEIADIVIKGEGEYSFLDVVKEFKRGRISVMKGNVIEGKYIDVEQLPFPAYDYLVPDLKYYSKKARIVKSYMAPILTSRGCPYQCIFCDKSVHGTKIRARSPESVFRELKWLREKYGIYQIDILDDNFAYYYDRTNNILDGIAKIGGFAVNCQNGLRADSIDSDLVKKMKKSGVFKVGIGIESGSVRIVDKICKKLDLKKVENAIKLFREARITVHGYFIIGFPFEAKEDILKTIKFAKKVNPHFCNFSLLKPIVGTTLYNQLKTDKIRSERLNIEISDGFFTSEPVVEMEHLSPGELRSLYKKAWRSFYIRPSKIFDLLFSIKSFKESLWVIRIGLSILNRGLIFGREGKS